MGRVLFETGDTITEDALRDWLPQEGNVGYFDGGATPTVDYGLNEVSIGDGRAHLLDSDGIYTIEPDSTTLSLPDANGENYLYAVFNPASDESAEWVVSSTQGGTSEPKLLKSVIDTAADTDTLENEHPDAVFDAVTVDEDLTLNGQMDRTALASTTATATGGSDPADEGVIPGVSVDQFDLLSVLHSTATDPAFDADYAASLDWWPEWDDSDGEIDIGYQLTWQTDPGSSNDVDYDIEVFEQ